MLRKTLIELLLNAEIEDNTSRLERLVLATRLSDYRQHLRADIDRLPFIVAQDQDSAFIHDSPFSRSALRVAKGFLARPQALHRRCEYRSASSQGSSVRVPSESVGRSPEGYAHSSRRLRRELG